MKRQHIQRRTKTVKPNNPKRASSPGGLLPARKVLQVVCSRLEKCIDDSSSQYGLPSGFSDLDKWTLGWHGGDLIVLAARPAMGKTALALNFLQRAVLHAEKEVVIFSLDGNSAELMSRLLSTGASIEGHKFRSGEMDSRDFTKLYEAVKEFNRDNLHFNDDVNVSVSELAERCRELKRDRKALDLVIVDNLQLLADNLKIASQQDRECKMDQVCCALKSLADELRCSVIVLSGLHRAVENRPDKRPRLSDLSEIGDVANIADVILFLYRDEVYDKDSPDKGVAEIIVGKNRGWTPGTVKIAFDLRYSRFHELTSDITGA